ncbi:MAG: serine acetyltransferase [Pseudomonadota bacterium]
MLSRVFVGAFGSVWNLKRLCIEIRAPLLKKILIKIYGLYQYENGSSIAWNSKFHGMPCFPHGMKNIFISGGAEIGRNCVIFQQVTIGSNTLQDSGGIGAPVIGEYCYIGAGAKIIGNIKIGNNVRIGANAVVYKDVADNSVVFSGEQRTVSKAVPLDNRFYSYHNRWVYFCDGQWVSVTDELVLRKLMSSQSIQKFIECL